MSFLKSAVKYGEIIINRTEDYARIAKLKIDIKCIEDEIEKCYKNAGKIVISEYGNSADSFSVDINSIKNIAESINKYKAQIEEKKHDIAELKGKGQEQEDQNTET
ncbi:MAG: hypothetical protein FWG13_08235 [Leptospirales bacterium]|nr:hypothetical protein [Leptospirales bacterium]